MAAGIGEASALLALINVAFQSSVQLYETVKSFKSHQQRVRDLNSEVQALSGALNSLNETVRALSDIDFSALELPLKQCSKACKEFEKELLKFSSRSTGDRTSWRDWAKLRYMGDDVDDFRRQLQDYKMTISVCLADANLRKSSVATEKLDGYKDLLSTTKAGLEDRLERMDEKLEAILKQSTADSDSDVSEVKSIKEERLSTEKCLQICAQLADHISQIQLAAKRGTSGSGQNDSSTVPERITNESLQECKESLGRAAAKLQERELHLFGELMEKLKTVSTSGEGLAQLSGLRDEWEATRQGMDICSKAQETLKDSISNIENHATGDALQFMVSTNGKTLHGKNQGLGWRTRQVGGHLSDESLQEITRALTSMGTGYSGPDNLSSQNPPGPESNPDATLGAKFEGHYGKGFKLTPGSTPSSSTFDESAKARRKGPMD